MGLIVKYHLIMMHQAAILMLMLIICASAQRIHYIKPNNSLTDCPDQCLTLDQVGENLAPGDTFVFSPGNHSLDIAINLTNISDLTFRRNSEHSPEVNIICINAGSLFCHNVSNLTIDGLKFILLPHQNNDPIKSILSFWNCEEISLFNTIFEGSGNTDGSLVRAIYSKHASITIANCFFSGNTGDTGGAMYIRSRSNITLYENIFIQNKATIDGGALFARESTLIFQDSQEDDFISYNYVEDAQSIVEAIRHPHSMVFSNNQARYYGGAIYLNNSVATMSGTNITFMNNSANLGGAIWCLKTTLNSNAEQLYFVNNKAESLGGAICLYSSSLFLGNEIKSYHSFSSYSDGYVGGQNIKITVEDNCFESAEEKDEEDTVISTTFANNQAHFGGGLALHDTLVLFSGTNITFINNSASEGGAMFLKRVFVTTVTRHLNFTGNKASYAGGAIFAINGSMKLGIDMNTNHYFVENLAENFGGAIAYTGAGLLAIQGNTNFKRNYANMHGGAILKEQSLFYITCRSSFASNHAELGGAISFYQTGALFHGTSLEFRNNSAYRHNGKCYKRGRNCLGGAIASQHSQIKSYTKELNFIENSAVDVGGAISTRFGSELTLASSNFLRNHAEEGGAIHAEKVQGVLLHNITVTGCSGSAIVIRESPTTIGGTSIIEDNFGEKGGAIYAANSVILLTFYVRLINNRACIGGAIFAFNRMKFIFSGLIVFENNTAETNGGAIYAVDADITFNQTTQFEGNSAQNGGAMFFESETKLTIATYTYFNASYNHASEYGGVIYHEDSGITTRQCEYDYFRNDLDKDFLFRLPYCFISMQGITFSNVTSHIPIYIKSDNNTAGLGGSYIYGGFMDKCQVYATSNSSNQTGSTVVNHALYTILRTTSSDGDGNGVSSKPYLLCFCNSSSEYDCYRDFEVEVYRGQSFYVPLLALAQSDTITSAKVTAIISLTARLELDQSSQKIHCNCTQTKYNVYSTEDHEEVILYPDGPCIDRGLARAVLNVTLLPCPDGFNQFNETCDCDARLQEYDVKCTIGDDIHIEKNSNFWIGISYLNESYQGLILYKSCPAEYCKINVLMYFDNLDYQCNLNRSGVLCGACATNYSLVLGGSKCQVCSNTNLYLLAPFVASGIALIFFLSVLKLTVAKGYINSLILYANIVQANKSLFFPPNTQNVLTVFIAWMNLDLGFQTCFYDGMDAYAKTWLQFAFPLYVWFLISLIIVTSRYSITLSKLIGHNPIAVLATLLLMSYTKILKIIIEVYSSVNLEYPDELKVTVWLKDANIPYLQSKHLILTVVITLVLFLFFLPYTLFLLLGYKLYRFFGWRYLGWLIKIMPLLDSYYAPYEINRRYWTGFILLIRCILYIIFSFNSLGATNMSLLAIIITFSVMELATGLMKIYKSTFTTVLESFTYINFIVLSAVTLAGINNTALVYTLVGIVFVKMCGIIVYSFHILYTAKSAIWLKMQSKVLKIIRRERGNDLDDEPLINVVALSSPRRVVTYSVIDQPLNESLQDLSEPYEDEFPLDQ